MNQLKLSPQNKNIYIPSILLKINMSCGFGTISKETSSSSNHHSSQGIRLIEEILHHLGCIKQSKSWDIYHINWCRIISINSMLVFHDILSRSMGVKSIGLPGHEFDKLFIRETWPKNEDGFRLRKTAAAEFGCHAAMGW